MIDRVLDNIEDPTRAAITLIRALKILALEQGTMTPDREEDIHILSILAESMVKLAGQGEKQP